MKTIGPGPCPPGDSFRLNCVRGADPQQVNSSGQRALDIARRNNRGASHQEVFGVWVGFGVVVGVE